MNTDNMQRVEMIGEAKITESNPPREKFKNDPKRPRFYISIENFRAIAYKLPEDHEEYSPDSFEVLEYYLRDSNPPSKEVRRVMEDLKKGPIVEFRYKTYTERPVWDKAKK